MGSCLSGESRGPNPGSPSANPGFGSRKRKNTKKRSEYKKDENLCKIPGRLYFNGNSEVASLFTQQGKKGINQDAMIVWENFCSRNDTIFCGVFDGHGPYGHLVAKRVRDSLPQKLHSQWEVNSKSEEILKEISLNSSSMNSEETSIYTNEESKNSVDVDENSKEMGFFEILKESFLKAFRVMDRELRVHTSVDCFCSGTTAVTLIKKGQDLVIGNVGDSRAVLGTRDDDDNLVAVQLTVDLKPNLPEEAERIKKCRGRVFALREEPEVARVWLPNTDSPGLAMARAFGDFCLKDYGLIAVPELSYRRLTEKDEFVVLATDGIWDVLTNKEVVDIVGGAPSQSTAAKTVVESAVRAWKTKHPTSKIDDCAVICLFLDSSMDNSTSYSNIEEKEKWASMEAYKLEVTNGPTTIDEDGIEDVMLDDYSALALEGVTRVNTLLNLPRYKPG